MYGKSRSYLALVFITVLLAISLISCSPGTGNISPASQPPTGSEINPRTGPGVVKSWQGSETKKTEIFTVTSDSWQINWSNDPQEAGGNKESLLQVYVHDVKLGTFPIYIAANSQKKESGTYDVHEAGKFYLQIDAVNTKWTIEVVQK